MKGILDSFLLFNIIFFFYITIKIYISKKDLKYIMLLVSKDSQILFSLLDRCRGLKFYVEITRLKRKIDVENFCDLS